MTITEWAIRHNRVTIVAALAMFLSGLSAYVSLPKAQDPGFTIRTATVTTQFPGASAERVELLVTEVLEEKIQEMPEVDNITSTSRSGISIVSVNFFESIMEIQPVFDDLRQKIEDVTPSLPSGTSTPIVNDDYGDTYGHIYSLVGDGFTFKELNKQAEYIRDELLKNPEVAKVDIIGDVKEKIYIEYDNTRLTELGLSPQELGTALEQLNILSSGGDIKIGRERISLEPTGNLNSIDELYKAIIEIPGRVDLVQLGDIAEVIRAYEDPIDVVVRVDGVLGISLAISMRDGGNLIKLGESLREIMPRLEEDMPIGIQLKPMFQQSLLTGKSVDTFVNNLFQAVAIVIAVMVLSLGARTGIVVASLIPVVMVSTFVVMGQLNIGIDQISLAALIIALGLLVDNAIVIVEATIVRRENGESAITAAINAAEEMRGPLLISSLTTAAAFTPIAFAESAVGEFTSSIFYVVTIALLLSWIVSMTLIPLLTPFIKAKIKNNADTEAYDSRFYTIYHSILMSALKTPILFCGLIVGLFFVSIYGLKFVPAVFIPPSEDPHLTIQMALPAGTDIEETELAIMRMETFFNNNLLAEPSNVDSIGILGWTAYIGTGAPRFVLSFDPANPNESEASVIVNVNNSASLDPIKMAIESYFFENEPDSKVQVKRLGNGPPVSYPIEIKVSGQDYDELFAIVANIKEKVWELPSVTAVNDAWGPQSKKLIIHVDQAKAFRAGVTNQDIATSLNTNLSGLELTEYREGDDIIPVVMRTLQENSESIAQLENITIFSQSSSATVPLEQVASIEVVWEASRIKRRNRERMVNIQVQIANNTTASAVSAALRPWLEDYSQSWPFGYFYEEGGETDKSDSAAASIVAALPMACIAIVLLLMLQFNSIRLSTIVLTTIPLGMIGIVFGLLVANSVFGFFTFLGLISLAGIVINNAIVLLDRIKLEIEQNGLEPSDAVVLAAKQRMRPILLTTATTVGGMLPLWIGGGPMFEPMAIAILFGLMFATAITLLLVPVMYSLFFKLRYA